MKNIISEIKFDEIQGCEGNIGLITLTRPQVLNALNHAMFIALDEQLLQWEKQSDIKAVIIRAVEGRAFCAGGDIRQAYERKLKNDTTLSTFFRDEYRMNLRLHHFSKPYIALLNGITMGGGAGISIHGSHRVATENLIFAMPETAIGFYPDVGMTYYLARFPFKTGYYLGLTGARISSADCLAIGLVQEIVTPDSLPKIIEKLTHTALPNKNTVSEILKSFALSSPHSELLEHKQEIEICFSKNSVEEIITSLESYTTEWCQKVAHNLKLKSPTSLKVTFQALKKAEKLNFDAVMQMEYGLTSHFIQGHDFFEGIRAVLVDKDQKPHWKPEKLTEVLAEEIENYFTPVSKELV